MGAGASGKKRGKVLVPTTTSMAVLLNPTNNPASVEAELRQAQLAAHTP